jgi:hypothetical protein
MRPNKESRTSVRARFGPEVSFSVPAAQDSARALQERKFEALKRDLVNEQLWEIWETGANALVRRAASDAASIAWTTAFPLLAFPELFQEKLRSYRVQAARQAEIMERSRELLAV